MQLMFVFDNNDVGLAVFSNIMAGFRGICSVDTNSKTSEVNRKQIVMLRRVIAIDLN